MGQVDGALFPGMTVGSDRGVDVANRALALIWAFTRAHARARAAIGKTPAERLSFFNTKLDTYA